MRVGKEGADFAPTRWTRTTKVEKSMQRANQKVLTKTQLSGEIGGKGGKDLGGYDPERGSEKRRRPERKKAEQDTAVAISNPEPRTLNEGEKKGRKPAKGEIE